MDKKPVFSIITVCYRRLHYLQESLGAMLRQTYPHIEIIIVNNGATPEVFNFITAMEAQDKRIKIVHFQENQYSDEDPMRIVRVCFYAALKAATGDYVFYQSDDELIADDYVEKMVKLFVDNPMCTSAAGITKDIDYAGQLINDVPSMTNYRPRYMPGHLLALSSLNDKLSVIKYIMFCAPGCVFSFKREELIRLGGYHPAIEKSHMFGVVPFGVTGFDETAILYWRRHEGQLNKHMYEQGHVGHKEVQSLLKDWEIEKRWEIHGKDVARYVARKLYESMCKNAADLFAINLFYCRFKACGIILKGMCDKFYFWWKLPSACWKQKVYIKYALKPVFRRVFEAYPWLVKKFPGLLSLQERAFK